MDRFAKMEDMKVQEVPEYSWRELWFNNLFEREIGTDRATMQQKDKQYKKLKKYAQVESIGDQKQNQSFNQYSQLNYFDYSANKNIFVPESKKRTSYASTRDQQQVDCRKANNYSSKRDVFNINSNERTSLIVNKK